MNSLDFKPLPSRQRIPKKHNNPQRSDMIRNHITTCGSLLLAAVACMIGTSTADELPKLKEKKTYKIGFSQTESNNPWRLAETQSVKDEAAKRGDQLVYTDAAGSAANKLPTLTA